VDNFASLLLRIRELAKFVLVPSWTLPPDKGNFSLFGFNDPAGWDRVLARANLPEMTLRREDFVAWRINWNGKAANLEELVRNVNLGLDSAVFIDDNPSERARVCETLPQVLVPDWPEDKTQYVAALRALNCFNAMSVTEEDRSRTSSYVAERQRQGGLDAAGSLDDWLQTPRPCGRSRGAFHS
jgi:FkbH-like protein